jgi:CDP-paratose 2-epimerase
VNAFRLAALQIDKTAGNVYNMGGGPANSVSIWHELRPRLERYAGRPLDITLDEWRPGDQPVYISDTRKAARDFSWRPRVSVEEGLCRLWDWAQQLSESTSARAASRPKRAPLRLPIAQPDVAFAGPPA